MYHLPEMLEQQQELNSSSAFQDGLWGRRIDLQKFMRAKAKVM